MIILNLMIIMNDCKYKIKKKVRGPTMNKDKEQKEKVYDLPVLLRPHRLPGSVWVGLGVRACLRVFMCLTLYMSVYNMYVSKKGLWCYSESHNRGWYFLYQFHTTMRMTTLSSACALSLNLGPCQTLFQQFYREVPGIDNAVILLCKKKSNLR